MYRPSIVHSLLMCDRYAAVGLPLLVSSSLACVLHEYGHVTVLMISYPFYSIHCPIWYLVVLSPLHKNSRNPLTTKLEFPLL